MDPSPVVRAIDWLAAHAARESDPTHNTLRLDIKFLCVTIHKSFEIREIFLYIIENLTYFFIYDPCEAREALASPSCTGTAGGDTV
jgi:hypothetical protein